MRKLSYFHPAQRRMGVVGCVLLAACLISCSNATSQATDQPTQLRTPRTRIDHASLPQPDGHLVPTQTVEGFKEMYDPALAPLGMRISRGAVIDDSAGGYSPSPSGTHLAVYTEPTRPLSADQSADNIWQLAAILSPDVFTRWPDLDSYDICQEPASNTQQPGDAAATTQLSLTREDAATIDWTHGTLTDLLRATVAQPSIHLFVAEEVQASATYNRAREESGVHSTQSSLPSIIEESTTAPGR